MAKLYFKYGSMGCGKSLELIRAAYNYIERNQNILLLSSSLDDRYEKSVIKSRTGLHMPCKMINSDTNIIDIFSQQNKIKRIHCVLVDEVQFFNKEQIYQLSEIVDKFNTPVIAYGLRNDFKLEPFEGSMYLLTIADSISEIKSVCHCGKKATTNARIINGKIVKIGEQIQIGGNESYVSLCRKHFKEGKLES